MNRRSISAASPASGGPIRTTSCSLPGRKRAASTSSFLSVVATTKMPPPVSTIAAPSLPHPAWPTPSISFKSVLRMREWTPPASPSPPSPRSSAMPSTPSSSTAQSPIERAFAKAARTMASLPPSHSSSTSDGRSVRNGIRRTSKTICLARWVFPEPEGPTKSTPDGGRTERRRSPLPSVCPTAAPRHCFHGATRVRRSRALVSEYPTNARPPSGDGSSGRGIRPLPPVGPIPRAASARSSQRTAASPCSSDRMRAAKQMSARFATDRPAVTPASASAHTVSSIQ
mmetsp:Transcript_42108/g.82581  ORF Transcript_42108/g.82581 Transcript_42108/m.82581 type:complete len:285 (-) Transcript_42108:457-1311(-)